MEGNGGLLDPVYRVKQQNNAGYRSIKRLNPPELFRGYCSEIPELQANKKDLLRLKNRINHCR